MHNHLLTGHLRLEHCRHTVMRKGPRTWQATVASCPSEVTRRSSVRAPALCTSTSIWMHARREADQSTILQPTPCVCPHLQCEDASTAAHSHAHSRTHHPSGSMVGPWWVHGGYGIAGTCMEGVPGEMLHAGEPRRPGPEPAPPCLPAARARVPTRGRCAWEGRGAMCVHSAPQHVFPKTTLRARARDVT